MELGVGLGFIFGYKIVFERGLFFDVGFGIGCLFLDGGLLLFYVKFNFGYCF